MNFVTTFFGLALVSAIHICNSKITPKTSGWRGCEKESNLSVVFFIRMIHTLLSDKTDTY